MAVSLSNHLKSYELFKMTACLSFYGACCMQEYAKTKPLTNGMINILASEITKTRE